MPRSTDLLTIGELSRRSGVAPSALRFYEERGLLVSSRNAGNQRRYERSTLRRIAFIRSARKVGLTLEEVAAALATLPSSRTPTTSDWHRLSRTWRERLDEQIERLERLRDQLDSCIGCGCLSLQRCQLSNPDDVLAERGPGAVNLEPRRARPPARRTGADADRAEAVPH
ncbi:redox-sensitive transcriptional activator SoxR [Auraticoccus sp. F435]|uniref:Redox-sensitive transcriptional activator SoxR n=1 Tax=Auraticoccus cholistanensis TaxID=2656650 RepID=A0A6A9USY6_9ACTN|nr:redox-sensitive transcriptional activator SoxR [Auraticoccus cholistanensis]MVA75801.1 redox-sensitive transcriptional activator SoxR [Auraticoccus cholistanensis]